MEQISRLELDRLVELYDLAHNADFSDASDKSTDEAYAEYIREVIRLHEAKFSNRSIENLKKNGRHGVQKGDRRRKEVFAQEEGNLTGVPTCRHFHISPTHPANTPPATARPVA
jgi:hypothetical protein